MRSILLLSIVFASLPVCFLWPWIGVLVFAWISYMNPHRYAWGMAQSFQVAMVVAVATLSGLFFTRERRPVPWTRETRLMAALWALFTFTTFFALNQADAWDEWQRVSKILLMTFVTLILIDNVEKLRYLLLTIALSIGAIGLKGGLWVIGSGGQHRVYGPRASFLADNNDLALALCMTLPLLLYLAKAEPRRWLRLLLRVCFVMTALAIIFTYSRGGLLTLLLVAFMLLMEAKRKSLALLTLGTAALVVVWIVPPHWVQRIETVGSYAEDRSAQGRFNAWHLAWKLALARPLTGGGFETFIPEVFWKYAPEIDDARDVHSIYFQVLGEHGFVALGLYLALLVSCLRTLTRLKKTFHGAKKFERLRHYPAMVRISILAYMSGGLFLGKAYFDLFYHLVAAVIILDMIARQPELLGSTPAEAAARSRPPRPTPLSVSWR